jgi:hypothetical protein
MAQANQAYITSRFHNLSNAALADALGYADAVLKGAEAETKSLKDAFRRRGLMAASAENFTVTATEQIRSRLDSKAVKEFLGASYSRFEVAVVSTIKAAKQLAAAA